VVLGGHGMSGDVLSRAFAPHLPDDDALVTVQYAERGVDLDAIYDRVAAALRDLRPESVRFYGVSMGGLVAAGLVQRYHRDGEPFGRAGLVLDTAPAGPDDIRRPDWILAAGCAYRGGALTSLAWAAGVTVGGWLLPQPTPEPDADRQVIAAGRHATRFVGAPAVTSQACFIHHQPRSAAGFPPAAADPVLYLSTPDPDQDPTVNVPQAIRHWQAVLPALRVVVLPVRRGAWHGSSVERPAEIMRVLAEP
jgi:pimeloyl-ACP methyl ester carboxylesterase